VWLYLSGEREAEFGRGLDVWSHRPGGLRAVWGQALEQRGLPPYVTGHIWLH